MASPGGIEISEELLTEWAFRCMEIEHIGTLIASELSARGDARLADLAGDMRRQAGNLRPELRRSGARNTNAHLDVHPLLRVDAGLPQRWVEQTNEIHRLAGVLVADLPRNANYFPAINLAVRASRKASEIYRGLSRLGEPGSTAI